MQIVRLAFASSAIIVAGCSTTSFSPPSVDFVNVVEVRGSNRFFFKTCNPNERGTSTKITEKDRERLVFTPERITEDVIGAGHLIDNFAFVYRCTSHQAADGRQAFEIPSFLLAAGGATAIALGAGSSTAIATSAGSVLFNGAKSYYAPRQKAAIVDSALDAVLCIKSEAAGISPYSLQVTSALQQSVASVAAATGRRPDGPSVTITAEKQFYDLILGALLSTERVLATRLSNVGSFDPAGTIAEIEKLSSEIKARDAEKAGNRLPEANSLTQQAVAANNTTVPAAPAAPAHATVAEQVSAKNAASMVEDANIAKINAAPLVASGADIQRSAAVIAEANLDLYQLQPRLQQCVIRAKI
jgi:hypothetical protein